MLDLWQAVKWDHTRPVKRDLPALVARYDRKTLPKRRRMTHKGVLLIYTGFLQSRTDDQLLVNFRWENQYSNPAVQPWSSCQSYSAVYCFLNAIYYIYGIYGGAWRGYPSLQGERGSRVGPELIVWTGICWWRGTNGVRCGDKTLSKVTQGWGIKSHREQ